MPGVANRGGSVPQRDALQGARYVRATFAHGSKAITTDVFLERNKPEKSKPIFNKLKNTGWTGQAVYLKKTASAREDMVNGAYHIAWDEVQTDAIAGQCQCGALQQVLQQTKFRRISIAETVWYSTLHIKRESWTRTCGNIVTRLSSRLIASDAEVQDWPRIWRRPCLTDALTPSNGQYCQR